MSRISSHPEPGALPVYRQIGALIVREIDAGRLLDGERLDPERSLALSLGTSVGTVRKALKWLEDQGLLERRHGSGNYVRVRGKRATVYAFFRIELLSGGGEPTAELLSAERMAKPVDRPAFGGSKEALRLRRLRRLNDVPAVVEEIWLDGEAAGALGPDDLSDALYQTYQDRLGLWIMRAEDRVSVGSTPDWSPRAFGCHPGEPCGLVERLAFDQNGAPVEFSRSWFDPGVASYVQRLK